ncbi:hypothetical protein D3C81_2293380 [compost metagenome]
MRIKYTILAVAGVWVQRNVGQNAEFGETLFQFAYCARHQPVRITCLYPIRCLQ